MTAAPSKDLTQPEVAAAYYDERYQSGYMQEWPAEKLARVATFVERLQLPSSGAFLDFGCGTGVFTALLQRALPGWRACGSDIVDLALEKARERCSGGEFFRLDQLAGRRFDFVFSHHVLEHVQNLDETLVHLAQLTRPGGAMIVIMPCGNAGSLEHDICSARRDGIDAGCGNRFFFEDEGHLRRLTTAELAAAAALHGFTVQRQSFANHHHGALKWLTEQSPAWLKRTLDPAAAIDAKAGSWLRALRRRVLRLRFLRRPPSLLIPGMEWRLQKRDRSLIENAALIISNPVTIVSGVVERWLQAKDEQEWTERAGDERGSEMYVVFVKSGDMTS
ncbi:MAG TPA: class I SAM-dependent methyltransferase [Vicinamibacterales bacterium]|nr:class I SAM-dependent methyltransferase [Vicinamibacterales bacterium]